MKKILFFMLLCLTILSTANVQAAAFNCYCYELNADNDGGKSIPIWSSNKFPTWLQLDEEKIESEIFDYLGEHGNIVQYFWIPSEDTNDANDAPKRFRFVEQVAVGNPHSTSYTVDFSRCTVVRIDNGNYYECEVSYATEHGDLAFISKDFGLFVAVNLDRELSISFMLDENTEYSEKIIYNSVSSYILRSAPKSPTKIGYIFDGWYTEPDGKGLRIKSNTRYNQLDTDKLYTHFVSHFEEVYNYENKMFLTIDSPEALIFGNLETFDVSPKIVDDFTMLPTRYVAESLGATVEWNDGTVKITKGNTIIEIHIGKKTATVDGIDGITLPVPAFIENDRTYCPVRFICESLGADVDWDGENRVVTITKNN